LSQDFAGEVAIVTGAGEGIGLEIARQLVRAGAAVVLNDLDPAKTEAAVATLRAAGGRCAGVPGDVAEVALAASAAYQHFERSLVARLGDGPGRDWARRTTSDHVGTATEWLRVLAGRLQQAGLEPSPDDASAVALVQTCDEYQKLVASSPSRPTYLGDLEAVSWTPPCETDHPRWTLDVWYLLAFDGRIGSGRSFLADLETKQIISVRDFSVRTG
jgi:NAD(P)-dependent dehydrogenase (short-subunit alcohol dehydrogenase family)